MDAQKVDMYMMMNSDNLPKESLDMVRERLLLLDESQWMMLNAVSLKSPTISLVLSIVVGYYGVDRFYIGDIGMGVGKLLVGLLLGWLVVPLAWWIVDIFLVMDATRKKNLELIFPYIS